MQQYTDLMNRIIDQGEWIFNERTGKKCKVIINADLEYDFCPLVTTRKSFYKSAIAEFVGYLRGYSSAADFRALGTKTWDANANLNEAWLDNPYNKGRDDMGRVYGVQGRSWAKPEAWKKGPNGEQYKSTYSSDYVDQLKQVYENIKSGSDNRGEIISFYNPGEFHMGCLRPCVLMHQFSLVGDVLHLHSYQRSCDVPLGLNFNMVQCYFFLRLMAQITSKACGTVYHKIVNAHIYEDQYADAQVEAERKPFPAPHLFIDPSIQTLEDVEKVFTLDHVNIMDYQYHPAIKYPMSV